MEKDEEEEKAQEEGGGAHDVIITHRTYKLKEACMRDLRMEQKEKGGVVYDMVLLVLLLVDYDFR